MSQPSINLASAGEFHMDETLNHEPETQPMDESGGQPLLPETLEVRPYPSDAELKTIQWAYAYNTDHTIFNSITNIFLMTLKDNDKRFKIIVETLPTYGAKDKRWIVCGEAGYQDPNMTNKDTSKRLARA